MARPFQPKTILFQWMKIETTQLLFVQSMLNRSSDLSGRMKLAKFTLFIYSKLEPKINKIYRNLRISGKPRVRELTRCVYLRSTANTSEIMSWFSDVCFSLILVNVSYFYVDYHNKGKSVKVSITLGFLHALIKCHNLVNTGYKHDSFSGIS